MKLSGQHIVIISNEPWGTTWYSKHNYAFELSQHNHVLFIDPVTGWSVADLFRNSITKERISNNLEVVRYNNVLPIRSRFLFKLNNRIVSGRLKKYFSGIGFSAFIFWSFDPYRLYDPKMLGGKPALYQCMDNYAFKAMGERELAANCDLVLGVGERLAAYFRPFHQRVHVIPHAVPERAFATDAGFTNTLPARKGYGLFFGNINNRLDFDKLEKIVAAFPERDFVLLGDFHKLETDANTERLFEQKKYKNLVLADAVPYNDLRNYIADSAFGFLFLKQNDPGNTISSQKLMQFFAQGKPVFSSRFESWDNVQHLLYMENDTAKQLVTMRAFFTNKETPEIQQERINYARLFSFTNTLAAIEKLFQT